MNKVDREAWLEAAAEAIFYDIIAEHTQRSMPPIRCSCGWPVGSRGGKRAIGTCHPRSASADGRNEIFISPNLSAAADVLPVLVHELIHATLDCEGGHRGAFARIARAVGLEGPMTATVAGAALAERLAEISDVLGMYPHATLNMDAARKKQGTRQRKCACRSCGLILRMSASAMAQVVETTGENEGFCPACSGLTLELDI